jgi:transcriptional repressor NrdR
MNCPFCQYSESKVLDSRPDMGGRSIRRRRECLQCAKRWRTLERLEDQMPMVLKRNGTHEPFDREKLVRSMRVACGKRPVGNSQIEQIEADIEWSILAEAPEFIKTVALGEMVMVALKQLDDIAYVRYASVYRRFRDVGELMAEMKSLVEDAPPA